MGLCGSVFAGEPPVGGGGGTMRKRKRACLCLCLCLPVRFYCGQQGYKDAEIGFTFYHLSTLNWYKAHTPRRYSGERLGNNKRELDILCLVISQRIDGVHAIFLLLIYIIARRPELYSTARVTTNDPVNDIRM